MLAIETFVFPRQISDWASKSLCLGLLTPQLMVNITYTILDLGPAALHSVRPPSLRVIYVADKYLIFIDYSAVWFKA
jgi:hypothetical protein